ncbi:DUF1800 family protein [Nonlabens sp. SY33080]|uniref:DUF1800 domain-containing protein n=1 Tax=Nonlabens sp. SY33080 TaxID=2719911 RepID=UPI001428C588|nr:DUF1800 family protein [Nonlabens sp. SY33080]
MTATLTSCNTDTLNTYVPSGSKPWNINRVRHAVRRLGYGIDHIQENNALSVSPDVFIEGLITDALAYNNTPAPNWGYWRQSDYTDYNNERVTQIQQWWTQTMNDNLNLGLKARMTMFWHNHFVTRVEDYNAPSWLFQYYNLLQTHCLGNFKSLTKAIGKNESMLVFLNGALNYQGNPNENYARELFELFTLGENNNYTQQDIVEAARALTGYNSYTELGAPINFLPAGFDNQSKTIFGVSSNFNHDTLIDHLFAVRANEISDFIIKKLYRYFVSPELPAQSIIDTLALTFRSNNWELLPVLRQLFKSEHFFAQDAISVVIKSPIDCFLTFIKEANFTITDQQLSIVHYVSAALSQELFNPVDVAGWQGDQEWINSTSLTGRWQGLEYIMWQVWNDDPEHYRNLALDIATSNTDPAIIARDIVDRFVPQSLHTNTDYTLATQVFKGDVPENYFTSGQWNLQWGSAPWQTLLLIQHIFRMPEFQLK